METAFQVVRSTWAVTAAMAPYLLLGFAAAGVLHVLVRPSFVARHLGRPGFAQVLKATAIGVPMPLCSCSVIPVTASLRRHGAGRGATVAFLASTPETGLDSIAATWGLLGPVFALARVVAAFAAGLAAGVLVERFDPDGAPGGGTNGDDALADDASAAPPAWRRALRHGFVVLPRDIGRALLAGLLVAGLVGALLPPQVVPAGAGSRLAAYLLVTLAAVPLYVCSTGSIPVALAMMRAGVSPGAALVFLIAGPATNAATIGALWKMMGRRAVALYLAALVGVSWACGLALDALPLGRAVADAACVHEAGPGPLGHAAAVALLAVLAAALRPRPRAEPCACRPAA